MENGSAHPASMYVHVSVKRNNDTTVNLSEAENVPSIPSVEAALRQTRGAAPKP